MSFSNADCAALSIEQARAYLGGISRAKLDQLVIGGQIASKKLGRRRLVLRASLDSFLTGLPDFKSAA